MTTHLIPVHARIAAEATCGDGTELEAISDRRGCAVWKATGPLRTAAVKWGSGPEGTVIAAREAVALSAMGPGRVVAYGRGDASVWMITDWYDGPSTREALAGVRYGTADLTAARHQLVAVVDAVAALHASGWVHGDLQPEHTVHTPDGVKFLDCSWAWHPKLLAPSNLFRGGLPHLLPPELAWKVHRGELPVIVSKEAEVYTLAASLWWAIDGGWPLDYAAADVVPTRMAGPELRHAIATRGIPVREGIVWPDVQEVLGRVLIQRDHERPQAEELADLLRSERYADCAGA
ncbi:MULTISPECIES: hypothetical protein [unclassified Streptomyces]|uniref:hypothetical protein n=1 Tax=unclassified Streptomyces TaxID=2593676 RepID=UPI00037C0649|nr:MULTISPECIES: hypothetical protein [unclassified Streptomyces]MYX39068.1 hypothetical protein [Streptomyces sp. SID8377]